MRKKFLKNIKKKLTYDENFINTRESNYLLVHSFIIVLNKIRRIFNFQYSYSKIFIHTPLPNPS